MFEVGEFFGELVFMTDQPRAATVRAGHEGARCLVLHRDAFDKYCSSNPQIFVERQEAYDTMRHEAEALLKSLDSKLLGL